MGSSSSARPASKLLLSKQGVSRPSDANHLPRGAGTAPPLETCPVLCRDPRPLQTVWLEAVPAAVHILPQTGLRITPGLSSVVFNVATSVSSQVSIQVLNGERGGLACLARSCSAQFLPWHIALPACWLFRVSRSEQRGSFAFQTPGLFFRRRSP